jgi:hypothetical protein
MSHVGQEGVRIGTLLHTANEITIESRTRHLANLPERDRLFRSSEKKKQAHSIHISRMRNTWKVSVDGMRPAFVHCPTPCKFKGVLAALLERPLHTVARDRAREEKNARTRVGAAPRRARVHPSLHRGRSLSAKRRAQAGSASLSAAVCFWCRGAIFLSAAGEKKHVLICGCRIRTNRQPRRTDDSYCEFCVFG